MILGVAGVGVWYFKFRKTETKNTTQKCTYKYEDVTKCIDGKKKQQVSIIKKGTNCPTKKYKIVKCTNPHNVIDCKMETTLGPCQEDGTRIKTYKVIQTPQGGKECPFPDGTKESITCNVDCKVSDWSEWSRCKDTKTDNICYLNDSDVGSQYRTRTITQRPKNNGTKCPNLKQIRQCDLTNKCANYNTCSYTPWSEWSKCSDECGGEQTRTRQVAKESALTGSQCTSGSLVRETRTCNSSDSNLFNPKCRRYINIPEHVKFNSGWVLIVDGNGAGQARKFQAEFNKPYGTVNPVWNLNPDETSELVFLENNKVTQPKTNYITWNGDNYCTMDWRSWCYPNPLNPTSPTSWSLDITDDYIFEKSNTIQNTLPVMQFWDNCHCMCVNGKYTRLNDNKDKQCTLNDCNLQCKNGGILKKTTLADGSRECKCECPLGFSGKQCQFENGEPYKVELLPPGGGDSVIAYCDTRDTDRIGGVVCDYASGVKQAFEQNYLINNTISSKNYTFKNNDTCEGKKFYKCTMGDVVPRLI